MALSASFQRFYDNAAPYVAGALPTAIQAALFETLRDFMKCTNIWKTDINIPVTNASREYPFTIVPSGTAVNRLMNLYNLDDMNCRRWFWPAELCLPSTIVLLRSVDQDYTLVATLALFPVDPVDADGNPIFPAWILDNYFDTLFNGTLWRLFAQPQKPWSNAAFSTMYYKLYMKGRGIAAADVLRSNVYNNQSWCFPAAGVTYGRQRGV